MTLKKTLKEDAQDLRETVDEKAKEAAETVREAGTPYGGNPPEHEKREPAEQRGAS